MQEDLRTYLLGASGITDLVGTRIYWKTRPQGTPLPAIVLHTISNLPDYHMNGTSGLAAARIQVDCWGPTYGSARLAARQVEARLSGVDTTASGTALRGGFIEGDRDSYEDGTAGERLFGVSLDFIIWHNEV